MSNDSSVGVAVWVTMVVSLAIGSAIGMTIERHEWKKKMIDYGYAQYDSETGEWGMIPNSLGVEMTVTRGIYNDDGTVSEVEVP